MAKILRNSGFKVLAFEVFVFEVFVFEVFVFEVFVFEVLGLRFRGLSFPNTRLSVPGRQDDRSKCCAECDRWYPANLVLISGTLEVAALSVADAELLVGSVILTGSCLASE